LRNKLESVINATCKYPREETMWYYRSTDQIIGPVSKEALVALLREGALEQSTFVRREDWSKWRLLEETELSLAAQIQLEVSQTVNQPVKPVNVSQNKNEYLVSLERLLWWWFVLYGSFLSIQFLLPQELLTNANLLLGFGLLCLSEIPMLISLVLDFILIYRFWQIIQDGFARTTPGKAVGFLLIPVFNIYWYFVAYVGLAKDQNKFIARHFDSQQQKLRKAHPSYSLGYLILTALIFVAFFIAWLLMIINLAILKNDPEAFNAAIQPYSWILTAVFLVLYGFRILINFDFFLTSKSILKAINDQISKSQA